MAAHVDPPELPDEEEDEATRLALVLSHFAATARPAGALDHEMLGHIARAAQFLDAHAFRMRRERLTGAASTGPE